MRKLFVIVSIALMSHVCSAQVKLQLSLLSDNQTYMVSMIPQTTWTYPKNITGTAQITLRFPENERLGVVNLKNLLPNVIWHDNAHLEQDQTKKKMNYMSFGLRSQGTTAIPYKAGEEVPLFTFKNYYGCISSLELVDNKHTDLTTEEAKTYNVGNHWTTVGSQKEAYTGNEISVIQCPLKSVEPNLLQPDRLFKSIMAYPVPTSDWLTVRLNAANKEALRANQFVVMNVVGKEVLTQKVALKEGEQEVTIDVTTLETGIYFFKLKGENVYSKSYKFLVFDTF